MATPGLDEQRLLREQGQQTFESDAVVNAGIRPAPAAPIQALRRAAAPDAPVRPFVVSQIAPTRALPVEVDVSEETAAIGGRTETDGKIDPALRSSFASRCPGLLGRDRRPAPWSGAFAAVGPGQGRDAEARPVPDLREYGIDGLEHHCLLLSEKAPELRDQALDIRADAEDLHAGRCPAVGGISGWDSRPPLHEVASEARRRRASLCPDS